MLKMTWLIRVSGVQTLKLEGELLGPWIEEVRKTCSRPAVLPSFIRLDLSAVTFVDSAGAALLHDLIRQGVRMAACSSFVEALLHSRMQESQALPTRFHAGGSP